MHKKTLLLVGDTNRVKEFAAAFSRAGTTTESAEGNDAALAYLKKATVLPDAIVFIVPVYWESVGGFVEAVRGDPKLAKLPMIYLGDFIESNDQLFLKRLGVYTLTLGPVPTEEAVRYIIKLITDSSYHMFDGHTQLG